PRNSPGRNSRRSAPFLSTSFARGFRALTRLRGRTINPAFPRSPYAMSMKMGLIGRKIGMTQVFHEDGTALGVTAVSVGPCVVVGKPTPDKHGYSAVQLGFEELPVRLATRPETGYFKKAGVEKPLRHLREVRLEPKDLEKYELGKVLKA